jgi:hypothetical protein
VDYNAILVSCFLFLASRFWLLASPQHDDSSDPGALAAIVVTVPGSKWGQRTG